MKSPSASLGPQPDRQSLDALDQAALPARERYRSRGARGTGGAAHLGLAHAAGGDVLGHQRPLASELVDGLALAEAEAAHQRLPEQSQRDDREHREDEPLRPPGP